MYNFSTARTLTPRRCTRWASPSRSLAWPCNLEIATGHHRNGPEKIIALAKAGERLCDRALERTRVRRPRSFSASRCAAPHAGFFV